MSKIIVPWWFKNIIIVVQIALLITQIITDNIIWLIGNFGLLALQFLTKKEKVK